MKFNASLIRCGNSCKTRICVIKIMWSFDVESLQSMVINVWINEGCLCASVCLFPSSFMLSCCVIQLILESVHSSTKLSVDVTLSSERHIGEEQLNSFSLNAFCNFRYIWSVNNDVVKLWILIISSVALSGPIGQPITIQRWCVLTPGRDVRDWTVVISIVF